ncbi:hypothetical protein NDJ39_19800 [Vibrio parahaemolyticus]|uniref:hypothetical protein n=1 Tax=Vibrio parahaemolyticus TaxID=670 RepID=UPI00215FFF29|nr:hypothetical protein [Vibrio parahaemolyticus]MCS0070889.1 hypothetical protein [Vibrio parahaemolyticus]
MLGFVFLLSGKNAVACEKSRYLQYRKRYALGGKLEADLHEIRVGKDKAEKYILQIWRDLNLPKIPKKHLYKEVKVSQQEAALFTIDLKSEIEFVRKYGKAKTL